MQFTYTRIRNTQRGWSEGGFDYSNEMPIVGASRRGEGLDENECEYYFQE